MLKVSCPSCGAPVALRSHASVMAVCEFCRATVHKDAGAVRELGRVSEVLEDYSRIQLGTAGVHGGRGFTVLGRIQLRYDAGMWNEWYLMFDDGEGAWLGDASGQYTLTTEKPLPAKWPAFDAVRVGGQHELGLGLYVVSDKRSATCIGGQGELPFTVADGWQARVADLRRGAGFATLDYSDGEQPLLYSGAAVTLEGLKCQLLRDDEDIKASAGRYRARVDTLSCPSCGTAIAYLPGLASNLVCQACATRLDASTPQAEVLAAGERHEQVALTLQLGQEATIGATSYRVLGALRRVDEDGEEWTEYLLYSTRGFFWLVETYEGWWRADVIHEWPEPGTPAVPHVQYQNARFERTLDYPARVTYAAGAFNWKVKVGDRVRVREFEHGQASLSAESNDAELGWSRSSAVAFDQVRAWFKLPASAKSSKRQGTDADTRWFFVIWLVCLNTVPLLFNFGESLMWVILGLAALFVPVALMNKDGKP